MKGEFLLFVALASFIQCFSALPLTVDYGLSKEESALLDAIIVNQEAALAAKLDGHNLVLDVIEKYVSFLVFGTEASISDDASKIGAAIALAKDGVRYFLNAVQLIAERSCDTAIQEAIDATEALIDRAYGTAGAALGLAASGNYTEDRTQMETYQASLKEDITNMIGTIYMALRTCVDAKDAETTSVIQQAEERSNTAIVQVVNAVFNTLKAYAAAVTAGKADVTLIQEVEASRNRVSFGLRTDIENEFGLIKALYLNSKFDQTGILPGLMAIQYAQTAGFYRNQASADVIFDLIKSSVKGVALGFSDDGDVHFSPVDVAQATAIAELNAGNSFVLASLPYIHRDGSSASARHVDKVSKKSDERITNYFNAFHIAMTGGSDYAEAQKEIENLRHETISQLSKLVSGFYYGLVRGSGTWDAASEAQFTEIREAASVPVKAYSNSIYDAILRLLEITHKGQVNEDDVSALQKLHEEAISALNSVSGNVSAASLIALKANN